MDGHLGRDRKVGFYAEENLSKACRTMEQSKRFSNLKSNTSELKDLLCAVNVHCSCGSQMELCFHKNVVSDILPELTSYQAGFPVCPNTFLTLIS
ncbi:hypothetical protein AVEN_254772-1 [Araneus ventricosus]|uniref:Uncharacterized protein n=1 Tax=Araneus ventricosus TaxID=182803 RepID=A0A4Y2GA53_ARAVE|nr:hypothetical protein AVEN_254772-1 [Araneus ventricosus]